MNIIEENQIIACMPDAQEDYASWLGGRTYYKKYIGTRIAIGQRPNFSGAIFANMDLTGFNFKGSLLDEASFARNDLTGANLSWTSLVSCNYFENNILVEADLRYAFIVCSEFHGNDLTDADATNARIERSTIAGNIFTGTILIGADLSSSLMGQHTPGAIFREEDHSQSRGGHLAAVQNNRRAQQNQGCILV